MKNILLGSFLLIFLTFFSQFSKDLIPYSLDLPNRMFRQVAILGKCLLYLFNLVDLGLVLPFITANFNL